MLPILIELQRLKRLDRTGWTLRGLPNGTESVAAHSFGVSVTAMILADELANRGVRVNTERVLRMALLHDWAERRVGDMQRQLPRILVVTSESGPKLLLSLTSSRAPALRSLYIKSFTPTMNCARVLSLGW